MKSIFVGRVSYLFALSLFLLQVILPAGVFAAGVPYDTYTNSAGERFLVLGIQGSEVPTSLPLEVVVLVDTSASQTGQFRLDSLDVVRETLSRLPQDARVKLMAIDVQSVPFTESFVAPKSAEMTEAFRKLQRRTPLGATDLTAGIISACESLTASGAADVTRSVIYIGNGSNRAKPLTPTDYTRATQALIDSQTPFIACALGPQVRYDLLGAIANRTGGTIIDFGAILLNDEFDAFDRLATTQQEQISQAVPCAGETIVKAIKATVIWLDEKSSPFPTAWEVYPKKLPPIRSDRETIFAARSSSPFENTSLTLSGKTRSVAVNMGWDLVPSCETNSDQAYIQRVFELAKPSDGIAFPLVGREMVDVVREQFVAAQLRTLEAANFALQTNEPTDAATLAKSVLKLDPKNKVAQKIAQKADSLETAGTIETGNSSDAEPALVDSVISAKNIKTEKLAAEVTTALGRADKAMSRYPDASMQELRLTMAMVRENSMIKPEEKAQLLDKLGYKLKQVQRAKEENDRKRVEQAAILALSEDRQRAIRELDGKIQKVTQIFKRYDSLMDAKEYDVAEQAAELAHEILPEESTPRTASALASMTKYVTDAYELRHKRERGFVAGMQSAERSFIPVMDEPPIIFPDAAIWRILSERRRERWMTSDITGTESEKRIRKILDRVIDIDLPAGATLDDLIGQIKAKNPGVPLNILVQTDEDADEEVTNEFEVTENGIKLTGMTLRSALRRILSPLMLGYYIADEALIFAHDDTIKNPKNQAYRVYQVADLTAPMNSGGGNQGGFNNNNNSNNNNNNFGGNNNNNNFGGNNNNNNNFGGNNNNNWNNNIGWSVPDKIASTGVAATAQNAKLDLSAIDVNNLDELYENYFTQISKATAEEQKMSRLEVHATVQRLMRATQSALAKSRRDLALVTNQQIIAIINAALRHEQMQFWMYESLAISLYIGDSPQEEIARAILSAADLCQDPLEVALIARFAEDLDAIPTAITLYQQAINLVPMLRTPYARVLRLAVERRDSELIEWATLAISQQVWEGNEGQKLTQEASDAAAALQAQLRNEGKTEKADSYAAALAEASLRDCIVEISWTGDALLSVAVQEPNGSVCWALGNRSLGGGVWEETTDGKQAKVTYTCPVGFAGNYRISVLRDFGKVTDDTICITASGVKDGKQVTAAQFFKLNEEGTMLDIVIPEGRRTEAIDEAIVATAARTQIVAQEGAEINNLLNRMESARIHAQIGGYESTGAGNSRNNTNPTQYANPYQTRRPYIGSGAVGYRPVIQMINAGVQLNIPYVGASADRRFVVIPDFSMPVQSVDSIPTFSPVN